MTKQTNEQNRTKDIEIKNKVTVIGVWGVGITRERRGSVKSSNMYKGSMDKDNGVEGED